LRFGFDGKLYVTTGDASNKELAQKSDSLGGKILRMNKDGSIPSDNPFTGSFVYSIGHRNPQGIDFHPVTGQIVSTEHGPSIIDGPAGGDEVNLILPGENYGWPLVSHEKNQDGLIPPLLVFTPALAPASGVFYKGDLMPELENSFLFGALRGQGLFRVWFDPTQPWKTARYDQFTEVAVGRVRDVAIGPDGAVYFVTSNLDGRGQPREGDDAIYRLTPAE
jgi:aldose sugar dehydrogenase